jgi:hypothetical protein
VNLAHTIATHDHDFEGDVLAQTQGSYPEVDAQESVPSANLVLPAILPD